MQLLNEVKFFKKRKLLLIFLCVNNIFTLYSADYRSFSYEKESEFIERTQQLLPSKHFFNATFNHFIEPVGGNDSFYVTCPYNRDCAILRPAQNKLEAQFVLIDYQDKVCNRQFLNYKNIQALALAAHHEMFAVIYESQSWGKANAKLLIENIDTKQTIKYKLPKAFEIASVKHHNTAIAFNKQNTHIILWGVDTTIRRSYREGFYGTPALDYMIFSLYDKII